MPKLCVIPGDGIGQEVIPAAVTVLQAVIPDLETIEAKAGWDCFLEHGTSVPAATLDLLRECRAGLFGAVSSPSRQVPGYRSAVITMRQELDLYACVRPVRSWPRISPCPDIDMIIVRENTEGLYCGREYRDSDTAIAERVITRQASRRIAHKALSLCASMGRRKLTIVHKANILPVTDGLFRDTVLESIEQYRIPIEVEELLVDVAALKIVAEPTQFDVLLTTNLFGDIISDAAAYWGGGLGLVPSINWGEDVAVAEPVHGSAPDISGKGVANPTAAILSGALLARHAWDLADSAERVETAVSRAFALQELPMRTGAITQAILMQL